MKKIKLPNMKKPCKDCPFIVDSMEAWLGEDRIKEILSQDSFICHKTIKKGVERLQCAGHMIIKKEDNVFYRTASIMGIDLRLSGSEKVFDNEKECIKHHSFGDK